MPYTHSVFTKPARHRTPCAVMAFTVLFASAMALAGDRSKEKKPAKSSDPEGPYIEETIYEGRGFAGLEIGDPADDAEEVLGEASGGSEHCFRYRDSRFSVRIYNDEISGFRFLRGFRGKLADGGIGIGDSLDDVIAAYGAVEKEREVNEFCDWRLDRTLLIRRGGPSYPNGPSMKLYCYDAGLYFFFDDNEQIVSMGLWRKTDYLDRRDH